ncbi:hypothetical protein J2X65_001110 [Ancylobacter sp. 3268]|uniref:hypothetical protein n=1 Tax=Ancylobacter sp. 3268 TaxID=2817752 RepID=UPI002865CDCB|nr:hypothetical protein [Ancylobacter sp. 3268]MDR6951761.1 hypothetical protein [Ancylobacter sp. 3268]
MLHARIPHASKPTAPAIHHAAATLALLLATGGSALADCKCRAGGRDYQHGARVCLSGSTGPRTAVCGMDQNVASWIFLDEPCAVSARPPGLRVAGHLPSLR